MLEAQIKWTLIDYYLKLISLLVVPKKNVFNMPTVITSVETHWAIRGKVFDESEDKELYLRHTSLSIDVRQS